MSPGEAKPPVSVYMSFSALGLAVCCSLHSPPCNDEHWLGNPVPLKFFKDAGLGGTVRVLLPFFTKRAQQHMLKVKSADQVGCLVPKAC